MSLVLIPSGWAQTNAFRHDAYVWQRAWTDEVTNSVAMHAGSFGELLVLRAEVTWERQIPRSVEVKPDFAALVGSRQPVGLALRIGSFAGPFAAEDERTRWLALLAKAIIADASSNGLTLAELQLDFDCAESKLDGYRVWVGAIRRAVAPTPVTITALPAWLNQPAFARLAAAADGFVLQVHSFERPGSADPDFQLCDPKLARRAVEKAARVGRPFRVALPTYGYVMATGADGRFLGISAEGPKRTWPASAKLREVWADPASLAGLVREWTTQPPPGLRGIVWYRLPVASDVMNWRWPTLAAVMSGEVPAAQRRVVTRSKEPGLIEVELVNEGTANAVAPAVVELQWKGQRLVAADGVRGFAFAETGPGKVRLQAGTLPPGLKPGERRTIGWLRFETETEVQAVIHETAD